MRGRISPHHQTTQSNYQGQNKASRLWMYAILLKVQYLLTKQEFIIVMQQKNDGVKKEEGQRMEKTQEREERVLSAIKSAVKSAN